MGDVSTGPATGSDATTTTTEPQAQVFYGTFIYSRTLTELAYLPQTAIFVSAAGVITAIEPCPSLEHLTSTLLPAHSLPPSTPITPSSPTLTPLYPSAPQFFFPGLIDTHTHAAQYPNAGIFGHSTLLAWLEKYTFPLESSLKILPRAKVVYETYIARSLSNGTTAACYHATQDVESSNLLAKLCWERGQRALVGKVCMDERSTCPDYYRDRGVNEAVEDVKGMIEFVRGLDSKGELVRPCVTPRFAVACSGTLMGRLGSLARREGVAVQTHVSENHGEIEVVKRLHPVEGLPEPPDGSLLNEGGGKKAEGTYVGVYDAYGLLKRGTILAHAVHVSEEEAEVIAARGAGVSHCPVSNSAITSGEARVKWLMSKGVEVGLGTDVSGGFSTSVLEAARQALMVSRHVAMVGKGDGEKVEGEVGAFGDDSAKLSVEEVLYLATRGGAKLMGLGDKVGAFEVGMEWDAQLVGLNRVVMPGEAGVEEGGEIVEGDKGNVDVFGWESWDEIMAKWLFSGDDRNTKKVWVKGRLVHERKE